MVAWLRKLLIGQLSGTAPLTGWVRRKAALALADDLAKTGAPETARALAEAACAGPGRSADAAVQQTARQALERIEQRDAVDAVCGVWAARRAPWLAEQIARRRWVASEPPEVRVLSALQAGETERLHRGGAVLVRPLVTACADADPRLAEKAQAALLKLRNPNAVDALCAWWLEERNPRLAEAIARAGYVASEPLRVRVFSALQAGRNDLLEEEAGAEAIEPLLQAAEDRDPALAGAAAQVLSRLQQSAAQEALCKRVIESGHPLAEQAARQGRYLPADEHQRALYLFVTGQWEAYEALDFDRRLLRTAYEAASPALRRRVMDKIRLAGRTDYLTVLAGQDFRKRLAVLAPDEASFLVQMLAERQEWERLWNCAFELPLAAGVRILRLLNESGWQPPSEDERRVFSELAALAQGEIELSGAAVRKALPPGIERARARTSAGRINSLAFSPRGPVIALGTSSRRVVLWNYQRGEREQMLGRFDHSIGPLTYTSNGTLVFGERTNRQDPCALYAWRQGEQRCVWQCEGSVTAVAAVPGGGGLEQVLAAGRDGQISLIELNGGSTTAATSRMETWARSVRVAPDGEQAALLFNGVALIRLPELKVSAYSEELLAQGVIRCAVFAPAANGTGPDLLVGKYNGEVLQLEGPDLTGRAAYLYEHTGRVEGLEALPAHGLAISAGSEGVIRFTDLRTHAQAGWLSLPGRQITSLNLSPDEAFMAVGDSDASLSLWDLRLLDVPGLFELPLARTTPNHLAAVRLAAQVEGLPAAVRQGTALVERLLRHRFRFDIEIDDLAEIKFGQYEIEIE